MPKFQYKAVNGSGKRYSGVLEAATQQQAAELLREQGLWVTKLIDRSKSLLHRELEFGGPKVKTEHFTVFCRQLATMYKAGIGLVEAVRILSKQSPGKPFRKLLAEIAEDMKGGTQFSVAVSAYPTVFTPVFVNMVRAGEVSGKLDEMLERLAVFFEKERNTKEKVKSAMVYPAVMMIIMVLVVIFMMIFVIPRYVESFASMSIELPLPTRIVMGASEFMQGYWYIVVASLFVPSLLIRLIRREAWGRERLDYIKLKIPVFGKLWHKQAIARFSRTFSSLFAAAIPLMQGLSIVSDVVGNQAIGKVISDMKGQVRSGNSMAESLKESWLFPPMVVQMIAVGERSGSLDSMLEKVADFYEADVDAMAERLKSLLEPLMIVVLTGVVGLIVLAVLMPSFELMQGL
ncbi:type II secretion system F family protein [Paenibacillus abyssi]|uniref:Secretion system protein n=1 Tax=Paenibacillus abyssi TaxID=1340531 RepID=A0A917G5M8_9BACL|nr:type II secretion system F family protein [Paenibacillus abyssi]GGG23533.1 secretion system protein [Paenibacillus abyssi]